MKMKKMLVPVDLHEKADAETHIARAAELARLFQAEVLFLNVVDIDLDSAMLTRNQEVQKNYAKIATAQLQSFIDECGLEGITYQLKITDGRSYARVVEISKEFGSDVIVLNAHKPGMKEYLLGMTAARVVRHAACSVIVIRE